MTSYCQDPKYYVFLVTKFGGDGFSTKTFYKGLDFCQKNIFAVTCVPVMIKALDKTTDKSYVVWVNSRANSAFACRPLHYEFMKEDREHSAPLGENFLDQAKNLQPYSFIGGIIAHDAFATLLDGLYYIVDHFSIINFQYNFLGKGKSHWLKTSGPMVCFICLATPTQMSKRWNEIFRTEPRERLMVGASNCHLPVRILVWLIKGTEYQDFRYWRIDNKNPDQVAAAKKRKAEYQVHPFKVEIPSLVA